MKKHIFKVSALSALAVTGVVTPIIAFATSCNKPPVVVDDYVETVTKANQLISSKTFNTMSSMLEFLEENNIDLQAKTVSSSNAQYVWDKPKNKIFLLKNDGTVFHKPEGFTPSENKASIWKMVKAKTPTKLFSSKSNASVYADQFDETTQYSQYLRDGETFSKSLSFCSGIDTGSHEKLQLTFNKAASESTEPVVINTMKSSLEVNGSWSDVNHYGNLTELTVESLGESKSYNEYGSVDAAIKVKQGTITAQAGSDINSVVVTSESGDDVQVNVKEKGYIGSIGASEVGVPAKLNDIVEVDAGAEVTKELIVKSDVLTPEPKESNTFYSGEGTILSPWTIKTTEQLWHFAEEVAKQTTSTKYYFNLIADIDMNVLPEESQYIGKEWDPVGTASLPFKGIFNGCGFAINNLTINPTTQSGDEAYGFMGLFGYTNGDINSTFHTASRTTIWKESDKELDKSLFAENKYTTSIQYLTLNNVTSENSGVGSQEVGSVVGRAMNTYFNGVHVNSGKITGSKAIGGIAGTVSGCVLNNCTAGTKTNIAKDNLTVTANQRNVGGLTGGCAYETETIQDSAEAFIGCVNYAIVTQNNSNGKLGGYAGGMVGICQSENKACTNGYTVFEDCINLGNISAVEGSVSGIAPAKRTWIYNRCINSGNLSTTNADHNPGYDLAGMGVYGLAKCYDCHNYGEINGWCDYISGILAHGVTGYLDNTGFDKCGSEGKLSSDNGSCVVATISSGLGSIILKDVIFNTVTDLNNAISSAISSAINIELIDVTVTHPETGTLQIPERFGTITSNKTVANQMNISSIDTGCITINIPNININITGNCPNADIRNISTNSILTVNENGTCAAVAVGDANSKIINNGIITGTMSIDNYSQYGENNGTCGGVSFGGTYIGMGYGSKKLINNGTIKRIATNDNQHVLFSIGGSECSIEIDNKGTIEYDKGANDYCGYLMCLYNSGTIVFKTYENSKFITNDPGNRTLSSVKNHMNIYYKPTAVFEVNGVTKQWTSLKTDKVEVESF